MSAALQYYHFLPSIDESLATFGQELCKGAGSACGKVIQSLAEASYVDIDYDTINRAVVINAGWPSTQDDKGWTETLTRRTEGTQGTTEIGVLTHEPNPDPEDIGFGGFLTVLGQSSSPRTFAFFHHTQSNTHTRTHTLPNPHAPLPPPPLVPANLHHFILLPNRPTPHPPPLLPHHTPHPPKPIV